VYRIKKLKKQRRSNKGSSGEPNGILKIGGILNSLEETRRIMENPG
jgi:hypothetical protein